MASIQERPGKDGKPVYRVQIRLKGFPIERATFYRKTDAKKWAQQTEAAMREGRHFKTAEAKKHTFGEMIDRYIQTVLPSKPKSIKAQKLQLFWWRNQLGHSLLSDITSNSIGEKRDKLLTEPTKRGRLRSPSTVVRYLAALSHVYTICVKEWGWVGESPMPNVAKPKEPRGRVRFLNEEERKRFLLACQMNNNPWLYIVAVLALSTGMRQGEIMNLRWENIDLEKGRIVLHETKNGERRAVPLAGLALILLKGHGKENATGLLFPSAKLSNTQKPVDLRFAWRQALKMANLKDFRPHDLRHCAASYLVMNGASLSEIANVLGHKTLQMVKRYTHISDDHAAKVVAKMNNNIFT
jgi:integrase